MRQALAWIVLALIGFAILNWGEIQPYVRVKTEGWSPLGRAAASSGLYEALLPEAAGSMRDLRLIVARDATAAPDCLFYFQGPDSGDRAAESVARALASDDVGFRKRVEGSFVLTGDGWAVAWFGPSDRAQEVRQALSLFGGPGSGAPAWSLDALGMDLRAAFAFESGSISTERMVYLVLGVGKRLARPGTVVLRLAAVLAPDGPFWVWVFEASTVAGLVCLALALGGYPPFRRKRPKNGGDRRPDEGQGTRRAAGLENGVRAGVERFGPHQR